MMKKSFFIISVSLAYAGLAHGQSAINAYRLSQPDMKGTARFMSMGGAFGALGGDLSSLSQNPAGIGVYRSNEIGFSLNLDLQSSTSNSQGNKISTDQTKFLLNNIGGVVTMRLPSQTVPNLNFGFTYNKGTSYNRAYAGQIPRLTNSLSYYIAGITEGANIQAGAFDKHNPYADGALPWLSTLGYQGWLIDSSGEGENTRWYGQWENGVTQGFGSFDVLEKGSVDEYNIALGGNIANVVYWGMNFDITNLNYTMYSRWGETLSNAFVPSDQGVFQQNSTWDLSNYYNVNGTGFNYQIGVIVKPIQELRIGLAVHTPTWYSLNESFGASVDYQYGDEKPDGVDTNDGYLGTNSYDFRTPWKFIGSLAGVIGNNFILSMDYEYVPYNKMKFSAPGSYGLNGGGWDYDGRYDVGAPYVMDANSGKTRAFGFNDDPYYESNSNINYYYQATHSIRLGAEYRVTPAFSLRAGYSYTTSPVKQAARDDKDVIYTSGTLPNYRFDNHTNYISCGFGYRYKQFSIDMAYVYKNISSSYHAYSPDVDYDNNISYPGPSSKLSLNNSQVILSAGFRF